MKLFLPTDQFLAVVGSLSGVSMATINFVLSRMQPSPTWCATLPEPKEQEWRGPGYVWKEREALLKWCDANLEGKFAIAPVGFETIFFELESDAFKWRLGWNHADA